MKKELAKKNKSEMEKELDEKLVLIHSIRFGAAGSKSKNVKEQRNLKRDIARLKTTLNDQKA